MLIIHLFNLGGQLVLHQYFVYLSDKLFNERTSKGLYNNDDLSEVKLPANMPGMSDWGNYENISGQIQFKHCCYNYVKMKITRNALYLMCVPNYKSTRLSKHNIICANDWDISVPKKGHVPHHKSTSLDKFSFAFIQFEFFVFSKDKVETVIHPPQQFTYNYPDMPEQPPQQFC